MLQRRIHEHGRKKFDDKNWDKLTKVFDEVSLSQKIFNQDDFSRIDASIFMSFSCAFIFTSRNFRVATRTQHATHIHTVNEIHQTNATRRKETRACKH